MIADVGTQESEHVILPPGRHERIGAQADRVGVGVLSDQSESKQFIQQGSRMDIGGDAAREVLEAGLIGLALRTPAQWPGLALTVAPQGVGHPAREEFGGWGLLDLDASSAAQLEQPLDLLAVDAGHNAQSADRRGRP